MPPLIPSILAAEIALYTFATTFHLGIIGNRNEPDAGTAEIAIAFVLAVGLALALAIPHEARDIALYVQGFAMLGTLVGFTLVVTGIGPHKPFDVIVHGAMLILVGAGLVVTARFRTAVSPST